MRMIIHTLTHGLGVALAALAGVLAAPIDQVQPSMGSGLIITVFAVVVIGGMGSLFGAILTGFGLGMIEALTKVYYPLARIFHASPRYRPIGVELGTPRA